MLDRFTWRKTAEGTAEQYYLELEAHAKRRTTRDSRLMLTVDFERLGLVRGERLLDLGAGGGRHAFEAMRRGARVDRARLLRRRPERRRRPSPAR